MPDNKHSKKVHILDGGSLVIDRSQVLWHIDVGTPVRFPVYSVLIEHPDGLFMYDTGYDLDHVNRVLPFEQPEQTPDQTIPAQLKAAGFDPEQVSFVVNSHFHFDHVGGNKYLTNATTLVNTAELRHAKVPEPFEHLGYSDPYFDFPRSELPLRPRGRQQVPDQCHHAGQHGGTAARQGPRAVRAPRLLRPVL